ncbi:P-loop containing nucleoside triphosphate hydrolase protein [Fennellomyces sp. T-0311]|nr:P-loop containing nucleoside triphosphate hydrolase protein [Fennellomyces sp. T-0311]
MDRILSGIPFVGELFALTTTNSWTTQQQPISASSTGDDPATGLISSKYAPFINSILTIIAFSIIPRIVQAVTRWIYPGFIDQIYEMFYVSIQINQDEDIFFQVGQYVAQHEQSMYNKRLTQAQGVTKNDDRSFMFFHHLEEISVPRPQISILPKSGTTQIIWHNGRKIWVTRKKVRAEDTSASSLNNLRLGDLSSLLQRSQEIMEISMRGRNVEELKAVIQEWIDTIYYRDINKLTVYQCMRAHHSEYMWKRISNKEMRKFDSVVLREGQKEEILADVQKFLGARKKYGMRGIPYRHAVILHGPPGTGKTSFIKGLAEKLRLNIAYISLAASIDDDGFLALLARVPEDSMVVMEDFDRSHITKDSKESDRNGAAAVVAKITEAGLLNALDGINTPEGTLVFLTCNDINKINDVVKRPGRVDQIYHLSYADDYQIEEMFWRFFGKGEETVNDAARAGNEKMKQIAAIFVSHVRKLNVQVTTATLQKFFLEYEKEQEIQHWKREIKTKYMDLEKRDEKRKNDSEDDIDDQVEIDLGLLSNYTYVEKLFDKIQVETTAEDKIKEEAAKWKEDENMKESEKMESPRGGSDDGVHELLLKIQSDAKMGESIRKLADLLETTKSGEGSSREKIDAPPPPPESPLTNGLAI